MNSEHVLVLENRDELHRFDLTRVMYMHTPPGDSGMTHVYLANGERVTINRTLSTVRNAIVQALGYRASFLEEIGKNFIINREYVLHIEPNVGIPDPDPDAKERRLGTLLMGDGTHTAQKVYVRKTNLKELKRRIAEIAKLEARENPEQVV